MDQIDEVLAQAVDSGLINGREQKLVASGRGTLYEMQIVAGFLTTVPLGGAKNYHSYLNGGGYPRIVPGTMEGVLTREQIITDHPIEHVAYHHYLAAQAVVQRINSDAIEHGADSSGQTLSV